MLTHRTPHLQLGATRVTELCFRRVRMLAVGTGHGRYTLRTAAINLRTAIALLHLLFMALATLEMEHGYSC